MTKAEFKTKEDYDARALYLLTKITEILEIRLTNNKLSITINTLVLDILASELLDIYKEGWDDRSIAL